MKKQTIIIISAVILITAGVGWRFHDIFTTKKTESIDDIKKQKGIPVEVIKPDIKSISNIYEFLGSIEAYKEVSVSAKIGEEIVYSSLELGKPVYRNQVVVRLNTETLNAQLRLASATVKQAKAILDKVTAGARVQEIRQIEANVNSATAQYNNAQQQYNRMKNLNEAKVIPDQQLDTSEAAYKSAKASMEASQQQLSLVNEGARKEDIRAAQASYEQSLAQISLLKINLKNSYVRSPMTGVVSKVYKERGEQATSGGTIFSVVAINSVYLIVDVSEQYINAIKPGQSVTCKLDSIKNRIFHGQIANIAPKSDAVSRTFIVKILLDNPSHILKPGMFSNCSIIAAQKTKAVVIPKDCIFKNEKNKDAIYVVKNNKAMVKVVLVGLKGKDEVEISSPDISNDEVILTGQTDLVSDAAVYVKKAGK